MDRVKLFESKGCIEIKFSMALSMEIIIFFGIIVEYNYSLCKWLQKYNYYLYIIVHSIFI